MIEGRMANHPDLILAGIGISRHDVPTLYVRSVLHHIDAEVALYETYFKTKIVDLSDVGIPLFRNRPDIYPLYPKTSNALTSRLRIQGSKALGTSVWDLYESRQFEAIKERTASEVDDAIAIASQNLFRKVLKLKSPAIGKSEACASSEKKMRLISLSLSCIFLT